MTADTLRAFVNRRPFEPLRLKTTSGDVFEIRHPEMSMITKTAFVITHPNADGSPSDKVEYIGYLHIVSAETLAGAAA